MVAPRIGVLALQGDVREHLAALDACGVCGAAVRLPEEVDAVDGLILPGGESTTMSRLLRVFGLEVPLRRRLEGGMPCLATCAGTILLSRSVVDGRPDQIVIGALDVVARRNGYGRQVDSFECPLDLPSLGAEPFPGVFIRAPLLERAGPAVEVLASLDGHPVAVRQGSVLGLTFHPEMTTDLRLHRLFLASLPVPTSG